MSDHTRAARDIAEQYLSDLGTLLEKIDLAAVERSVERLREVRDRGGMVYVAGNGGSAATATHLTNDLGKATKRSGCPPFRIMSLSDNVSWLTALGNDEGYERAFVGQMENFARAGDVLIVITASGRSPNVVSAVDYAREHGLVTLGLLGFDGGVLRDRVDELLLIETEPGEYGLVESAHVVIGDLLTTCLMQDRPSPAAGTS